MSTRAASASKSRLVRQRLVNILFNNNKKNGVSNNNNNNHNNIHNQKFSYEELRTAYLKRIQDLHPDKFFAHRNNNNHTKILSHTNHHHWDDDNETKKKNTSDNTEEDVEKRVFKSYEEEFRELQDAWSNYEAVAKDMKKMTSCQLDANFTMFGVGCSFSDSPEESKLRSEIMDQAGRGWFSAGCIPEESPTENKKANKPETKICLTDEDLFIEQTQPPITANNNSPSSSTNENDTKKKRPKSLIDHMFSRKNHLIINRHEEK